MEENRRRCAHDDVKGAYRSFDIRSVGGHDFPSFCEELLIDDERFEVLSYRYAQICKTPHLTHTIGDPHSWSSQVLRYACIISKVRGLCISFFPVIVIIIVNHATTTPMQP